jgi:hypothetical protein
MLILVATLGAMAGGQVKLNLGTPMMVEPPRNQNRVEFELRGNRVVPVELQQWVANDSLVQQIDAAQTATVADRQRMCDEFNRRGVRSAYHRFELRNTKASESPGEATQFERATCLLPTTLDVGDRISDLSRRDGVFQQHLAKANPSRQWVLFVVRPDSFEALRVARQVAKQLGFNCGWDPIPQEEMIGFSPSGRHVSIDSQSPTSN